MNKGTDCPHFFSSTLQMGGLRASEILLSNSYVYWTKLGSIGGAHGEHNY